MSHPVEEGLKRGFRLHLIYWVALGLSLTLTIGAWAVASAQQHEKLQARFERESQQLVNALRQRLAAYENALLAGVGMLQARQTTEPLTRAEWEAFAATMNMPVRYPGALALGVIEQVASADLPAYAQRLADRYPDLPVRTIPNSSSVEEHLIVGLISPPAPNAEALGLDLGFDQARLEVAQQALKEGEPRITRPLILVQDQSQSPGIVMMMPFEVGSATDSGGPYTGLVLAPVIIQELLDSVADSQRRGISLQLRDVNSPMGHLFADDASNSPDYDPYPMFQQRLRMPLYGQEWEFAFSSQRAYRQQSASNLPAMILIVGLSADFLLLIIFALLLQSNLRSQSNVRDLSRRQRETERQLRQRNDELVQFNYRVSHDLVAPLRTMSGLLDILRIDMEDGALDEVQVTLSQLEHELAQQIRVLTSIFTLSQADLHEEPTQTILLKPLVQEIFATVTRHAADAGIELTLGFESDFQVEGQPTRLFQVLDNLLSNAVKFRHPQRPWHRVDVSAEIRADLAIIRVRDNGIGIPPAAIPRVFDLFFRGHSGHGSGAGLGLYIVRKSMEHMGGTARVYSDSSGSCFEIEWPQHAATSTPSARPSLEMTHE